MKCPKCGLEFGYPFSVCPKCGYNPRRLYEARPTKQEYIDAINTMVAQGKLSDEEGKKFLKPILKLYEKQDETEKKL
jgi:predicted amidophosphoribosyltransferase